MRIDIEIEKQMAERRNRFMINLKSKVSKMNFTTVEKDCLMKLLDDKIKENELMIEG